MPIEALALVLVAALLHATWNLAAKKAGGDHRFAFISAAMVAVLWAPLAAWWGLGEVPRWGQLEWTLVGASSVVHVAYYNVLLKGYRVADFTVVYPLARGSGPLISAVGAVLLMGERLSAAGAAGVLAVCAGIFLIAGGPALWRQAHDPDARTRLHAGLRWGALTGILIAIYTLIDGYAVKIVLVAPVLLDYMGNLLRVPLLLPAALRDRAALVRAWQAQWRHALVVAVLSPLAYVLVLYAVKMAPLSHVAPAREVSMLIAALLGGRLLGEQDRGLRLAGAACMALGVVALTVG
jgi:drug/metabolite transporter (DMT)-like permease